MLAFPGCDLRSVIRPSGPVVPVVVAAVAAVAAYAARDLVAGLGVIAASSVAWAALRRPWRSVPLPRPVDLPPGWRVSRHAFRFDPDWSSYFAGVLRLASVSAAGVLAAGGGAGDWIVLLASGAFWIFVICFGPAPVRRWFNAGSPGSAPSL